MSSAVVGSAARTEPPAIIPTAAAAAAVLRYPREDLPITFLLLWRCATMLFTPLAQVSRIPLLLFKLPELLGGIETDRVSNQDGPIANTLGGNHYHPVLGLCLDGAHIVRRCDSRRHRR